MTKDKRKVDLKRKIQSFNTFRGKVMQPWMHRARNRPEFHTKHNESVRSSSGHHEGKEILFPRIRMRGPGLEKMTHEKAFKEAVKRKDYIKFKTPDAATKYSIAFSDSLGRRNKK